MSDLYEKLLAEAAAERRATGLTRSQLVGARPGWIEFYMENTERRNPPWSAGVPAKVQTDPS